jgi:hypothetical protein
MGADDVILCHARRDAGYGFRLRSPSYGGQVAFKRPYGLAMNDADDRQRSTLWQVTIASRTDIIRNQPDGS